MHPVHRHHPQRLSFLEKPDPGVVVKNLYLSADLGPRDLMSEITGVGDFDRVASRAVDVELFGQRVRIIGIDDLITAKELRAILARREN